MVDPPKGGAPLLNMSKHFFRKFGFSAGHSKPFGGGDSPQAQPTEGRPACKQCGGTASFICISEGCGLKFSCKNCVGRHKKMCGSQSGLFILQEVEASIQSKFLSPIKRMKGQLELFEAELASFLHQKSGLRG